MVEDPEAALKSLEQLVCVNAALRRLIAQNQTASEIEVQTSSFCSVCSGVDLETSRSDRFRVPPLCRRLTLPSPSAHLPLTVCESMPRVFIV